MNWRRIARHLLIPRWTAYRPFPRAALRRIEAAIGASEKTHDGELRLALEASLDLSSLLRGISARQRARQLFAQLDVWDTAHNSGVLIYLQLVDGAIEILADRGISARVDQKHWNEICRRMEASFRGGRFEQGVLDGVGDITALLKHHFPARGDNPDELPDRPVLL